MAQLEVELDTIAEGGLPYPLCFVGQGSGLCSLSELAAQARTLCSSGRESLCLCGTVLRRRLPLLSELTLRTSRTLSTIPPTRFVSHRA